MNALYIGKHWAIILWLLKGQQWKGQGESLLVQSQSQTDGIAYSTACPPVHISSYGHISLSRINEGTACL